MVKFDSMLRSPGVSVAPHSGEPECMGMMTVLHSQKSRVPNARDYTYLHANSGWLKRLSQLDMANVELDLEKGRCRIRRRANNEVCTW